MTINPYTSSEFNDWFLLAQKLFPDYDPSLLERDLKLVVSKNKHQTYLAKEGNVYIGFATVSTRTDYVEGSGTSPVGYLEAIYVESDYRKSTIATLLYKECEKWASTKSCTEMGSDTWLDNPGAQKFHEKLGFKEEDKLIHYIKQIDSENRAK